MAETGATDGGTGRLIRRHALVTRVTHWINVLCILALLMSGLQIFNAHPALYLGSASTFDDPVLSMRPARTADGETIGETQILGATFDTTGVLGLSFVDGRPEGRGFPAWATLPSYRDLATGRRWHFFFAWVFVLNGLVYVAAGLVNRHIWRDLVPSWGHLRTLGRSLLDHMRLRFHHSREYNILQKVTYLAMIAVVFPGIVLTGMTMSPGLNAALPWLVEVFGGRQTARTLHFVFAAAIVLFIVVHLVMVVISGPLNNVRSIVTGRYRIDPEGGRHA